MIGSNSLRASASSPSGYISSKFHERCRTKAVRSFLRKKIFEHYLNFCNLEEQLTTLKFDIFQEMRDLLLGHDRLLRVAYGVRVIPTLQQPFEASMVMVRGVTASPLAKMVSTSQSLAQKALSVTWRSIIRLKNTVVVEDAVSFSCVKEIALAMQKIMTGEIVLNTVTYGQRFTNTLSNKSLKKALLQFHSLRIAQS